MPTTTDEPVRLHCGPTELVLSPARGGGVLAFEWNGEPVFRAARPGPSPLDLASFPLVPFSNRIAHGRFAWNGEEVALPPNFPGGGHPHAIHGRGWQAAWTVATRDEASATLHYRHAADAWPWAYEAEQRFALTADGLRMELNVRNESGASMPTGLGFHPYFPRADDSRLVARHHAEWQTAPDGLPTALDERPEAIDWWAGAPVGAREVDTVYAGREGPIRIEWPDRALALDIDLSPALDHTVVFTPRDADFFCVEPVTHATDAINRGGRVDAVAPGETLSVWARFRMSRL